MLKTCFDSGTNNQGVDCHIAQGTFAGADDFDGPITPSVDTSTTAQVRNIEAPSALIMDGTNLMRKTFIFRCTKPRFIVVIVNNSTAALNNLVATVRILNYENV